MKPNENVGNVCNIVRDLLPLCAENMAHPDTQTFVEEHLKTCAACRAERERIQKTVGWPPQTGLLPLKRLKKKWIVQKIQTIFLTAALLFVVLVSGFAFLSAPRYLPYAEDRQNLTRQTDGSILLTFDPSVTGCSVRESEKGTYQVEAWNSLLDKYVPPRGLRTLLLQPPEDMPFRIYYIQNNGAEDFLLYGPPSDDEGIISLPRLFLGTYFVLALAFLSVSLMARFFLRKHMALVSWLDRLILIFASYLVGHLCIKGWNFASYSAQRDLALIVLASIGVGCAAFTGRYLYRLHRQFPRSAASRTA